MPSAPRLALHVAGNTDAVRRALDEFAAFIAGHAVAPEFAWKAQVALDEALANIVKHAYRGVAEAFVDIICTITADELQISLTDDGVPYDPLSAPAPDTVSPLEVRRPGGLGVRLMTKLMDEVKYSRREEQNVLVMRQRLSRGQDTR